MLSVEWLRGICEKSENVKAVNLPSATCFEGYMQKMGSFQPKQRDYTGI
jgi:hypothetical protein